ncbi:MAG: cytochrome-c peroxidase [Bacteroidota bacterium]
MDTLGNYSHKQMKSGSWLSYLLVCLIPLLFFTYASCQKAPKRPQRISRAQFQRNLIDSLAHFRALPKEVPFPEDNPPSEAKIALGRLLFFDPVLSGNKDVACATCHLPDNGFAESLQISIGVNGHGRGSKRKFKEPNSIPFTQRNSQTVLNAAFNGMDFSDNYDPEEAPMFWDMRTKSLENQALEPIKSLPEMRGDQIPEAEILDRVVARLKSIPAYQSMFAKAFPDERTAISVTNLAKAIACYERTLVTNNSRFDKFMRGDESAISISEKEGFQQFILSGCGNCHNGPMFSDYQMHVLGVPENKKLDTPDVGIDSSFAFRTPSLRNLRFSSPYMHNGSFYSLKRVLEFYEDIAGGKINNPNLSKEQLDPLVKAIELRVIEMAPIISFLNTLNDDKFDKTMPESVPSGLPVGGNL